MIGALYLSIVALGCAGAGVFLLVKRITFFLSAKRAIGRVVRWEPQGVGKRHYYPVVRFMAEDGNEYEFTGGPGYSAPTQMRCCTVVYPAENPQVAMAGGLLAYWAAPFAFLLLASAAGFAAIIHFSPTKT